MKKKSCARCEMVDRCECEGHCGMQDPRHKQKLSQAGEYLASQEKKGRPNEHL